MSDLTGADGYHPLEAKAGLGDYFGDYKDEIRKYLSNINILVDFTGGESGIRTHGTVSRTHAFQACALSHSAISPGALS